MTAPYAVRKIDITFQLSGEKITLSGLRVFVNVELATAPTTGFAQIRVFGMTLSHMNQLSKAGLVYQAKENNKVLVEAGDDITGMTTVFQGEIIEAYPDMRSMPDGSFYVNASPGVIAQLKPVTPSSFPGATPAKDALEAIVKKVGLTLDDGGIKAILASPYFAGTAWNQVLSCVQAANCFAFLDGVKKTLAVWPKDGNRSGDKVTLSPENGMIGYPQFQATTVIVRTLFTTKVKIDVGQVVKVDSQLEAADGEFNVISTTHDLMSEMPDGPWETTVTLNPVSQKRQ